MKITIIQVGKTRKSYFIEAEHEYLKRISAFAEVDIVNVKETGHGQNPTPPEIEQIKLKEAHAIIDKLQTKSAGNSFVIALDERGKQFTSPDFAEYIKSRRDLSTNLTFIIGGCYGLHQSILATADMRLSFSAFTFTHEMIRQLLLEQLYRAFTIIIGKQYHY